jgi:signal transduction histidine kinase
MNQLPIPPETTSTAAPRILVVDDEQHMCDVCSRTLRRAGYSVLATSDPDEAELALRQGGFDLLLTDIKMPTVSGLDLARIAREHDPAIAIIIMTGFASMEHLQESVKRGVADFLSKPFELDHLRLAVDQALHKRSLLQDNVRLRETAQLLQNSEQLGRTLDVTELAKLLLDVMLVQSGCRVGFLILTDRQQASSEHASATDAGLRLARRAIDDHQLHIATKEVFATFDNQPLTSACAIPLHFQGETHGVLLLCDEREPILKLGVQEGVLLLANHASAALRNAHLYHQIEVAYQRLQELDKLKSEFLAIASHELRTPLSIVLGYSLMVHDQSQGDQRDYMQRVMEGAQRIKEVVDDMVSLRHLETKESSAVLESLEVQEVINAAVQNSQSAIDASRHTLQLVMPGEAIVLQSDREKLLLIANHLISNAVKFTPPNGRIEIRVEPWTGMQIRAHGTNPIPAMPDPQSRWVVILFTDTGVGIAEHEQRRIFDRFYQVADSLRRDRGGLGLGLALVRELVITLGGIIWVTSQQSVGSTFAVALPRV